jgi:hypothetical protein
VLQRARAARGDDRQVDRVRNRTCQCQVIALLLVKDSVLDRVASILQIDKVYALDDTPLFHTQARHDANHGHTVSLLGR